MSYLFIAIIFAVIAILINQSSNEKWPRPICWAFYLSVGCASTFGALGLVTVLFQ